MASIKLGSILETAQYVIEPVLSGRTGARPPKVSKRGHFGAKSNCGGITIEVAANKQPGRLTRLVRVTKLTARRTYLQWISLGRG